MCTEAAAVLAVFLRNYGKPWSSSTTFQKTTKGSGTETPARRSEDRVTATVTVTVTADTHNAAGRRHTPQEGDHGAAPEPGAETEAETGAATRAMTGAVTRADAAARNTAVGAAATRAATRRSPRDKTNDADEAGATAKTARPRQGRAKRGGGRNPRGFPPRMPSNGECFRRRRPKTGGRLLEGRHEGVGRSRCI